MASIKITEHEFAFDGGKTYYLDAGPRDGPLLIFVHGFPCIAETWKHQLSAFANLGFRTVAPDCRGYGRSSVDDDPRAYRLERITADLLALLVHLQRSEAVWIGHDWGSAAVWALAAIHPEVCVAVINLCVPYHVLEYGLDTLITYVNRDIYPVDEYPLGQWDYQKYFRTDGKEVIKQLDASPGDTIKALFPRTDTAWYGKPCHTASISRTGGWFGGAPKAPSISLEATVLDEDLFAKLRDAFARNGFTGPVSWYLNHDENEKYVKQNARNGGVLTMPTFYIGARYDAVLDTDLSRLSEPMRRYCTNLTECTLDGGHWIVEEVPQQVNAAMARWLAVKVPIWWPGYFKHPLVSNTSTF
jgi:soluble epoxide hydrolase/lipid-phosphate phosphatase